MLESCLGASDAPAKTEGNSMRGAGRVVFAAIMLLVLGTLNIIYGIGALDDASIFVGDTRFIFTNLHTMGWVLILLGMHPADGRVLADGRQRLRPSDRHHRRHCGRDRRPALDRPADSPGGRWRCSACACTSCTGSSSTAKTRASESEPYGRGSSVSVEAAPAAPSNRRTCAISSPLGSPATARRAAAIAAIAIPPAIVVLAADIVVEQFPRGPDRPRGGGDRAGRRLVRPPSHAGRPGCWASRSRLWRLRRRSSR